MMQAQLDRTRAETNAVRDVKEKVERMLEGLGSLKMEETPGGIGEPVQQKIDQESALSDLLAAEYA